MISFAIMGTNKQGSHIFPTTTAAAAALHAVTAINSIVFLGYESHLDTNCIKHISCEKLTAQSACKG